MPAGLGLLQVAVLEEQSSRAALGLSGALRGFFCLFFFLAATSAAGFVCKAACKAACKAVCVGISAPIRPSLGMGSVARRLRSLRLLLPARGSPLNASLAPRGCGLRPFAPGAAPLAVLLEAPPLVELLSQQSSLVAPQLPSGDGNPQQG